MRQTPPSAAWNSPRPIAGARPATAPVASLRHFIGFLLIGVGVAAMGFLAQHAPARPGIEAGQLASHGQALGVYLTAIGMDWALLYYCWAGVHRQGGTMATLSGGRWRSARDLLNDLAVALPFWLVWQGAAAGLAQWVGPNAAKAFDTLLPRSPLEVLVWAAASVTAGVCEELGFRGYVQRQLRAFTGSTALAVAGQAAVFGIFHLYQGWKNVLVIALLGVLFGAFAAWRGNLRVNILSHAMTDFWEGWLKFVVWR